MFLFTEAVMAAMPLMGVGTVHLVARRLKLNAITAFQIEGKWRGHQLTFIPANSDDERPKDLDQSPLDELTAMRKSFGSMFVQIREEHCFEGIFGLYRRHRDATVGLITPRNHPSECLRIVLPEDAPTSFHINTHDDLQNALRLYGYDTTEFSVSLPAIFCVYPISLDKSIVAIDDNSCGGAWYGSDHNVVVKFINSKITPWEGGAIFAIGVISLGLYTLG